MKIIKMLKNQEVKKKSNTIDFRNSKGTTWNNKRRFGL